LGNENQFLKIGISLYADFTVTNTLCCDLPYTVDGAYTIETQVESLIVEEIVGVVIRQLARLSHQGRVLELATRDFLQL